MFDRALIVFLVFVGTALGTGATYFYLANNIGEKRSYVTHDSEALKLPLEKLTGMAARHHFLLVCFIGGLVGAAAYLVIALRDPYGVSDEPECQDRPDKRFAFLARHSELGKSGDSAEKPPAAP